MDIEEMVLPEETEVHEEAEVEETGAEETEVIEEPGLEEEAEDEGEPGEGTLYTQEQVEKAVKTRVNTFNKRIEKLKPYETAVKKISEVTGLEVKDLIARLEDMSVVEQARILGVSPQQLARQKQVTQSQTAAMEQTLRLQRELDEQKLLANPKYRDYTLYREEVTEILDDNPKLSIEQAYLLAKGEKATQAAVRDAEQRAVAKMTKSSNQRVIKPGSTPAKKTQKIDPSTIAAAKKVGMDPAEYAAYANVSSLDDYERLKNSKKG